MREILFRGKRIDNGEWVYWNCYGDFCRESGKRTKVIIKRASGESYYYHPFPITSMIRSETIGQYTGLKDKNGKRIFEGDIVRLIKGCPSCHDTEIVKFEDGGFAPFSIAEWECTPKWEECEVIGNIHDNSELLEVEHDR